MAAPNDTASMALFCDFENVALGVRDAQYEKFDIKPVLERLLAKGSIVVKKAYCDWDRYKTFKSAMHEANFELIEIPHVRQSGKNSADIRLVVDALDLCYTKSHVDTFVIISGDSDFSPLVSKLRENAKRVIGVGVKQSCSDLLVANCDEFIYYDDLVREREGERNNGARRENREPAPRRSPEEEKGRREKLEERKTKAIELATATFADLIADRGETERVWASVLKEVIKRRNPGFNENYFGFRSFGNLLEEAAHRGLLGFGRDEKSGAYVTRVQARPAQPESEANVLAEEPVAETAAPRELLPVAAVDSENAAKSSPVMEEAPVATQSSRRRGNGGRRPRRDAAIPTPAVTQQGEPFAVIIAETPSLPVEGAAQQAEPQDQSADTPALSSEEARPPVKRRRTARRPRQQTETAPVSVEAVAPAPVPAAAPKARKPRSRKPKETVE